MQLDEEQDNAEAALASAKSSTSSQLAAVIESLGCRSMPEAKYLLMHLADANVELGLRSARLERELRDQKQLGVCDQLQVCDLQERLEALGEWLSTFSQVTHKISRSERGTVARNCRQGPHTDTT